MQYIIKLIKLSNIIDFLIILLNIQGQVNVLNEILSIIKNKNCKYKLFKPYLND